MKFFAALQTDDIGRVQDLVEKGFDKVDDIALKAENMVTTSLRTTDTPVFHGLGRPIRGWIIVRAAGLSSFWEGTTSSDPSKFVNLKANGGPVTVTLLFF